MVATSRAYILESHQRSLRWRLRVIEQWRRPTIGEAAPPTLAPIPGWSLG